MNKAFLKEFVLILTSAAVVSLIPVFLGIATIKAWIPMTFCEMLVYYFCRWYDAKYIKRV